jgi:aspartate aminotransferase
MNLGVGAYRDEDGKPWVLPTVTAAEEELLRLQAQGKINHEYLSIEGHPDFYEKAVLLLLGNDSTPLKEGRATVVQCLSGTGGLRIGAAVLGRYMKGSAVYIPVPTWGNHNAIFPQEGVTVKPYRYYNAATCGLDFEGLLEDLNAMPPRSAVLFHACAHNPTGVDPTEDQWRTIAQVVKSRDLFPLLDSAYQGFASGDFDKDAFACRLFVELGIEMMVFQSFAKNMGLYGERAGTCTVICADKESAEKLKSQMKIIIRTMYSSPPGHGAYIASLILGDPARLAAWKAEVKLMADRIIRMRQELYAALKANGCPGSWEHVINQIGMFTFTGLKPKQVEYLTSQYHIYLTKDGRISMAGITSARVQYLADAIKGAVTTVSE